MNSLLYNLHNLLNIFIWQDFTRKAGNAEASGDVVHLSLFLFSGERLKVTLGTTGAKQIYSLLLNGEFLRGGGAHSAFTNTMISSRGYLGCTGM